MSSIVLEGKKLGRRASCRLLYEMKGQSHGHKRGDRGLASRSERFETRAPSSDGQPASVWARPLSYSSVRVVSVVHGTLKNCDVLSEAM